MITEFTGPYAFLSNFYPARVHDERGLWYPTVEHAYQAAKTYDGIRRRLIREAKTPGEAKRLGKTAPEVLGWNYKKTGVMFLLLEEKFDKEPLRQMLIDTYPHKLEEGNTWNDTFWGVSFGHGENHLGKMLMQIRAHLREEG